MGKPMDLERYLRKLERELILQAVFITHLHVFRGLLKVIEYLFLSLVRYIPSPLALAGVLR